MRTLATVLRRLRLTIVKRRPPPPAAQRPAMNPRNDLEAPPPPPSFDADEHRVDEGFVARLRQLVVLTGTASALAKKAGISQGGLSRYLNGGEPSRRVLVALARATEVELHWLATGEGPMAKGAGAAPADDPSTLRLLPYYSRRAASSGDEVATRPQSEFTSQAFCYRWLNARGLDCQHLAVMQVKGNSMAPTLNSGDMTLIDVSALQVEDDRIYLIENAGNLLLRRLQIEIGGRLRVMADNPQHHEFTVSPDEIAVRGRVVWRGALL